MKHRKLSALFIGFSLIMVTLSACGLGGGSLSGAASGQPEYVIDDQCEFIDGVACDEEGDSGSDGSSDAEQATCSLFVPDLGDAIEKGLVGTDAGEGQTILVATTDSNDAVIARISTVYIGTDIFQIPDVYRSAGHYFKVEGCSRWHSIEELGLVLD